MNQSPSGSIRVVVVDDTPDLRLLLRLTLERDGDITVVAEAENGRAGIDRVGEHQPDLVMLDLAMPVMDGLEALPQILAVRPGVRVIVLSGFEAGAMRDRAIAAGADAYVQKGTSPSDILALVRRLVLGEHPPPPQPALLPPDSPPAAPPTPRPVLPQVGTDAGARAAAHAATGLVLVRGAIDASRVLYVNESARALLGIGAGPGQALAVGSPALARLLVKHGSALEVAETSTHRISAAAKVLQVVVTRRSEEEGEDEWSFDISPAPSDAEVEMLRRAIGTTAHEIRNPVTLLSGVAAIIRDGGEDLAPAQMQQLFAAVGRQADVLERVTDDLLTAGQVGRGAVSVEPRPLDLFELLHEVVVGVPHLTIPVTGAEGVRVLADPSRLSQMVSNLVSNAVKYGKAPINVEVTRSTLLEQPFVNINIADSGAGVPEEFRPRLFQEFARAANAGGRGNGLGLFVVQSLAEAHGGFASYAEGPTGGSVFTLTLPEAV